MAVQTEDAAKHPTSAQGHFRILGAIASHKQPIRIDVSFRARQLRAPGNKIAMDQELKTSSRTKSQFAHTFSRGVLRQPSGLKQDRSGQQAVNSGQEITDRENLDDFS
jgi:hypothetical protein